MALHYRQAKQDGILISVRGIILLVQDGGGVCSTGLQDKLQKVLSDLHKT